MYSCGMDIMTCRWDILDAIGGSQARQGMLGCIGGAQIPADCSCSEQVLSKLLCQAYMSLAFIPTCCRVHGKDLIWH